MKRSVLLGVLVGVGMLSLVVAGYQGQPPGPKTFEVDKVRDNLYVLKGGGGNVAVYVGSTGVTVVDAKNPGWGQTVLDKIKELTNKPVTTLINTHTHGDHVGGNVDFPATVDIVAHENTKANMERMDSFKANPKGMAKRTFKDRMTIGSGPDQADLYYFGAGHTNGDAFVVWPSIKAMHAGDIFANKGLPLIDTNNGGNIVAIGETLQKAHDGIKGVEAIVTGHAPAAMTWADLQMQADFLKDFVKWARAEKAAGKSVDEAAAEYKVPEKYAGYSGTVSPLFGGMKALVQQVYDTK